MCKSNDNILNPDRAGWVLAGGRSRRMGADKALLADSDGRPLALQVAEKLARVCGTVSLVGDPARYSHLGLPVVPDEFAETGPLAGIEAALRTTSAPFNLIVACDMPALDCAIFQDLFGIGGDCALPQYADGRVEPLCAVYHRSCAAAIRAAIESGVRKVTDALRFLEGQSLELRYVRVPGAAAFANLNTPEDLQRYRNG
ncbi:MAG: molybdenum cofactor guanylyltransferase [Acidobacteriota bacterium]|nr:molybdenum cofactor guanylyltransferase [Acidobacteriota bacterium]